MALSSGLRAGRRRARRNMVDACRIRLVVGQGAPDPVTLAVAPEYGPDLYAGPCEIATYEAQEQPVALPGQTATVQRYTLKLPVEVGPFPVGAHVLMTAAAYDPHMTGRVYEVTGLMNKTRATSQRLLVKEVTDQ